MPWGTNKYLFYFRKLYHKYMNSSIPHAGIRKTWLYIAIFLGAELSEGDGNYYL